MGALNFKNKLYLQRMLLKKRILPFLIMCLVSLLQHQSAAFSIFPTTKIRFNSISKIPQQHQHVSYIDRITPLFAKKSKSKSNRATRNKIGKRTASASGFGGAAVEPCPCGSDLGYMKCCGKLHKEPDAFANATPEQVVRARYSAYAKREVSCIFLLLTTMS